MVQFLGIFHLRHCLCLYRVEIYVTIEREIVGHWVSTVLRVIRWYYVYTCACYVDFWKKQLHDSNVLFLWYTIRKTLSYMIPLYVMSTLNKCGCTEISVDYKEDLKSLPQKPSENKSWEWSKLSLRPTSGLTDTIKIFLWRVHR